MCHLVSPSLSLPHARPLGAVSRLCANEGLAPLIVSALAPCFLSPQPYRHTGVFLRRSLTGAVFLHKHRFKKKTNSVSANCGGKLPSWPFRFPPKHVTKNREGGRERNCRQKGGRALLGSTAQPHQPLQTRGLARKPGRGQGLSPACSRALTGAGGGEGEGSRACTCGTSCRKALAADALSHPSPRQQLSISYKGFHQEDGPLR